MEDIEALFERSYAGLPVPASLRDGLWRVAAPMPLPGRGMRIAAVNQPAIPLSPTNPNPPSPRSSTDNPPNPLTPGNPKAE